MLAVCSDLMLSVRLEEAARQLGYSLQAVADVASLRDSLESDCPQLVLVDLADRAFKAEETLKLIQERDPRPAILAFYPHVRADLEAVARVAGCDLLMPRSRFLLDLPAALRQGLAEPQTASVAPERTA